MTQLWKASIYALKIPTEPQKDFGNLVGWESSNAEQEKQDRGFQRHETFLHRKLYHGNGITTFDFMSFQTTSYSLSHELSKFRNYLIFMWKMSSLLTYFLFLFDKTFVLRFFLKIDWYHKSDTWHVINSSRPADDAGPILNLNSN